jgi:TonB family protein
MHDRLLVLLTTRILGVSVVGLSLLSSVPAAGQSSKSTQEVTVVERTTPTYPVPAKDRGVEGNVRYRVSIREDGTVEAVSILEVPRTGLGFEEATTAALKKWRFNSVAAGSGVRVGEATIKYELGGALPGEFMMKAAPRDVWNAARAVIDSLHLKAETVDDAHQFMVTRTNPYNLPTLPSPDAFKLGPQLRLNAIQLHVYVAPLYEPARIAIESIVYASRSESPITSSSRRYGASLYGVPVIAQWFADLVAKRIGAKAIPLSESAEDRVAQGRSLIPELDSKTCAGRSAVSVNEQTPGVQLPKLLNQVAPMFPANDLSDGHAGVVWVEAELTEHGTVIRPRIIDPSDMSPSLKAAAASAFTLWRFQPSMSDGCGARTVVKLQTSFKIK